MTHNWYNLIEDYNLGKLPESRRKQFERAMTEDPALAQAVQEHRAEWEANEILAERILRAQISAAFEEHADHSISWFSKSWKWISTATIVLIATVVLIIKNRQTDVPSQAPLHVAPSKADSVSPTPPVAQVQRDSGFKTTPPPRMQRPKKAPNYQALALAVYRTPEGLTSARSATDEGGPLALAQDAFAQKDYQLVLRLLESLPADSRQEGLSLRGHAYFLTGNYTAASQDFSDLLAGGVYIREAQWFGVLADMAAASADRSDWKKRLDAIRLDKHHPWQKDAAALWENLQTH